MRIRLHEDEHIEVQMAPLLDCMFLLLIFFLVATSLKKINKELDIDLPMADAAVKVPEDPQTLVLSVDRLGKFYVDGVEAGRQRCLDRIEAARENDYLVRIDADKVTRYQDVVEMLNLCKMRGVTDVKLHMRRQREGDNY